MQSFCKYILKRKLYNKRLSQALLGPQEKKLAKDVPHCMGNPWLNLAKYKVLGQECGIFLLRRNKRKGFGKFCLNVSLPLKRECLIVLYFAQQPSPQNFKWL